MSGETVTVLEKCSCGATFNWNASGRNAALEARYAAHEWRLSHAACCSRERPVPYHGDPATNRRNDEQPDNGVASRDAPSC